MGHSISDIAAQLGCRAEGNLGLVVSGAAEPTMAGPDHLALAMDPKFASGLGQGAARAAMVWDGADWRAMGLEAAIIVPRPRFAMAGLTRMFDTGPALPLGLHPLSAIDPTARIGAGAAIGPFVSIGPGATIGANARIMAGASIGANAVIGDDALIHEGVRISARVVIGHRFIAQPNAVIGGDGFSFVTPEKGAVEVVRATLGDALGHRQQSYARIHSLGAVRIGDDVEVGANACVDRGTISDTIIGDGTKIDNQVQIGHNVKIGRDCLLCGQVGIAGSTTLGDRCVLGGQVGVTDHLSIGNDVIAGAGTLLRTNQPDGRIMLGNPAMPMKDSIEAYKATRRLPRLFRDVAALKKALPMCGSND